MNKLYTLTKFGVLLTIFAFIANHAIAQTPLISLSFNEGEGLTTANTGSLSATFSLTETSPIWSTNVPISGGTNSVDFGTDAKQYVVESADIIDGLKGLTTFTITGWLNCRNSEEGGGGNRIVQWGNDGGDGVDFVYHSDGSVQMAVNQWSDQGNPPKSSAGKVTTDPDAGDANWVFVAVTYDATAKESKFYFGTNADTAVIDGDPIAYDQGVVGQNINKLAIGHFNVATRSKAEDRMFRGLIDEIRIYDVVLTAHQIVKVQTGEDQSIPVTGVSLNKSNLSLVVGKKDTLIATVAPDNATVKTVTWGSSDNAVATIDNNGIITAVSTGSVTITVTADGGKQATCTVDVVSGVLVPSAELNALKLYPNPVIDKLSLSITADKISVFNIYGNLILSSEKVNVIDLSSLTPGSYIVQISKNNQITKNMIIKK